jgi:hypothetical protein
VNAAYQNTGSNIDEDNDMYAYNLSKRLFACGLFCGRLLNLTSVCEVMVDIKCFLNMNLVILITDQNFF